MAVFLLKAKYGICYTPPPCTGVFDDVPCSSGFAPWIEQLAEEGITGGCGGDNYCPVNPVRRDQMAVFILKALHGASYVPALRRRLRRRRLRFPVQPLDRAAGRRGVTGGCGGGNYCPLNNVTRRADGGVSVQCLRSSMTGPPRDAHSSDRRAAAAVASSRHVYRVERQEDPNAQATRNGCSSLRRSGARFGDHLHGEHDGRLRCRKPAPGDPRRQRQSGRKTRSRSGSSGAAYTRSRRRRPCRPSRKPSRSTATRSRDPLQTPTPRAWG